jgi:hypothetical protein
MGLTPREVGRLSLAEWRACIHGWNSAQGMKPKAAAPSPDEHAARMARFKDR